MYPGTPLLLMTPLLSRHWRRLVTRISGCFSASWPITERSARRDAASLENKQTSLHGLCASILKRASCPGGFRPPAVKMFANASSYPPVSVRSEAEELAQTSDSWLW